LSLSQNRGLAVKPDGQFAPQNREALNHVRVAMLANHPRADQSRQFGDVRVVGVLPWQLKLLHALMSDWVLPYFTNPDGREVTNRTGTWMPHTVRVEPPSIHRQGQRFEAQAEPSTASATSVQKPGRSAISS